MTRAQQARERVREKALLEEAAARKVGKVSDREIDVAVLQACGDLVRRHRHGANRCVRCLCAQPLEQARQEHHFADIR